MSPAFLPLIWINIAMHYWGHVVLGVPLTKEDK